MKLGSLFAGIGGFEKGFEDAGFSPIWQVEKEPFCIAVLKTHWPNVERYYEIKDCGHGRKHKLKPVDCITAGVPCQDVSVAGKRAGLAGERTGLFYEFARILGELRPAWFVFENVPGLLSSNGGRDFAEIQRVLMVECGYGICWRMLDSQFFGVAQRRRRVFIVGYLGTPCPAEILFESDSRSRNFTPGREESKDIAGSLGGGTYGTGRRSEDDQNFAYSECGPGYYREGIGPLVERTWKDSANGIVTGPLTSHTQRHGHAMSTQQAAESGQIVATLNSGGNSGGFRTEPGENLAVAFAENMRGEIQLSEVHQSLSIGGGKPGQGYPATLCTASDSNGVRDFTGLPKGMDSPRYRALGNAVTVSVANWIAQRIMNYEKGLHATD